MSLKALYYYFDSILEWIDFKMLLSAIGGIVLYLFGNPTAGVFAFLMICVLDFVMWISIALYKGEFCRDRLFRGIGKYVLFGIALITTRQIDVIVADVIGILQNIDSHIILFQYWMLGILAIHEALSILGKLAGVGVPIPSGMLKRLNSYKEALESKEPEKIVEKK